MTRQNFNLFLFSIIHNLVSDINNCSTFIVNDLFFAIHNLFKKQFKSIYHMFFEIFGILFIQNDISLKLICSSRKPLEHTSCVQEMRNERLSNAK